MLSDVPRTPNVCRHTPIRTIVLFCSVQPATGLCPDIADTLHKPRSISTQPARSTFAPFLHSRCLPTNCARSKRCLAAIQFGPARRQSKCAALHFVLFAVCNKTTTKAVRGRWGRAGGRAELQGHYAKNPGSGSDLITRIKVTLWSRGGSKPIHKIIPPNPATVTKGMRDLIPATPAGVVL
jgi:hypothetical protein